MDATKNNDASSNNDIIFYNDILQYYKVQLADVIEYKASLSTIGNRTLSKNREFQIANDLYLRDLAQIERLKVTVIYFLVCIGFLGLMYINILPKTVGYVIIGLVLVAYILTVVFINNNFNKRYNLNYSLFKFNPDIAGSKPDSNTCAN
jgi:hypothetical protein